jgi:hypothetical protein
MNVLEEELKTYAKREKALKRVARGKFVVIKKTEIVGTFNTVELALTEATRRFGLEPYLVRQIGETIQTITL